MPGRPARVPEGQRVYAIGDIHGRLDLLASLAAAIEIDDRSAGHADTTVLLLGDLVDRGMDSAGVVDFALDWRERRRVRILMGNHEEMFLSSFTDPYMLGNILRCGGRETLLSYGIDPDHADLPTLRHVQAAMEARIPARHREFMASFEDMAVIGDYLFAHAGIEPGLPVEQQKPQSLRWIREPFLSHAGPYSHVVVHGHTIRHEAQEMPNRIGIDTGAYCYGRLTALVLEGTGRRFIQAVERDGTIATETRTAATA
ncbi:MAG: metallophosphoesterase family protein [Novosphingobium sp.]|nr:metallophosphoesterase family protein [Novosphingobium sp.]